MQSYHVDPHQFLAFVHDIDLTDLDHDPDLASILVDLPGRRLIYTNGSVKHAERITEKLGISHLFHGVHDIIAADYLPKPSHDAFARFMDSHGVTPGSAVFFDDMPHNLLPAHDLGLSTVWIDQTSDWSRPGGNGPHVHYRAECLKTFLRQARITRAENLQDQP
jgi:putative hydrolase of the HAD superfamily